MAKSGILWIPDMFSNLFHYPGPTNRPKKAICEIFRDFWDRFGDSWRAAYGTKKGCPSANQLSIYPQILVNLV